MYISLGQKSGEQGEFLCNTLYTYLSESHKVDHRNGINKNHWVCIDGFLCMDQCQIHISPDHKY